MVELLKRINLIDSAKKQIKKNDKVSIVIDVKKAPAVGIITDIVGTKLAIKVGVNSYSADAAEVTKVN